jgi:hypothetical protein
MKHALDVSAYSTVLFIDSMVALEGKPLSAQPWHEIDATGPILVLVVPQVNAEVDKRKRDGRLGKRAREFNRLIGPAAESGASVRISNGPPVVDIALAACDRIDWDTLDDLDPDEGDAKVVAQVLHAQGVPPDRKLLFSQDINPIAMASRRGLRCLRMPEHWLLEPEPSPNEKELSRLKGRVRELETTQPDLTVVVTFEAFEKLLLHEIRSLTDDEKQVFAAWIITKNPRVQDRPGAAYWSSDYHRRYTEYQNKTVPNHVVALHRRLEAQYNQIPFSLRLENRGHIQAENLVVKMKAIGGTLNDRFLTYPIFEPKTCPRRHSSDWLNPSALMPLNLPKKIGRHDIHFAIGPNRRDAIEINCADFRHGRAWDFKGVARIDPGAGSPFKIVVEVTASNFRGSVIQTAELGYVTTDVAPADLINLQEQKFLVEFPMTRQFDEALRTGDMSGLELIEDDDD